MRLDKSAIFKGAFLTLDCPGQVVVKRSEPPRFGQSSEQLDAIKQKIAAARRRLEEIAAEVAAAKRK
jgi:hypothetical protein